MAWIRALIIGCVALLAMPPAWALTVSRRGPASAEISAALRRVLVATQPVEGLGLRVRTRRKKRRLRVVVRVTAGGRTTVRLRSSLPRARKARRRAMRRLARRMVVRLRARARADQRRADQRRADQRREARASMAPAIDAASTTPGRTTRDRATWPGDARGLASPGTGASLVVEEPVVRQRSSAPSSDPLLEAAVGLGYGRRSFGFAEARLSGEHATGGFTELVAALSLFPLRGGGERSAVDGLGLRLRYAHALDLSTEIPEVEGGQRTVEAQAIRGWGGLVYLLPRLLSSRYAPDLELRFGFPFSGFLLEANETVPPHVELFLGWGAALVQPIAGWLRVRVSGEFRAILAAVTPLSEQYGVSFGSVQAGVVGIGLEGSLIGGLGYCLTLDYEDWGGTLAAKDGAADPSAELEVHGDRLGLSLALRYAL
jgi:hypothetical protein